MFSAAVERALRVALEAHAGQLRKSPEPVPYATHCVHVALILARAGADEITLQAGLLHDVLEDCEGWTRARLESEFGAEVAGIVAELSEDKTKSWEERKRHQVEVVPALSPRARLVKAADKLHNLRTLAADLAAAPDPAAIWKRFNGGRERTLARSAELVAALEPRVPGELSRALREALRELETLARR